MNALVRAYLADVPAGRLALFRGLVAGYAAVYLLVRAGAFLGLAALPATRFAPVGVLSFLEAPLPAAFLYALWLGALASAGAVALGRGGWPVRIAFATLLLVVLTYRNAWGMIFHTENLLAIHAIVLALASDAADGEGPLVGTGTPRRTPGWPLRLAATATALSYLLAGIAKLRISGLEWLFDETLRHYVAYDNVRKIELGDVHAPLGAALLAWPWVFRPLAAVTLAFELGFPLALVSRTAARVLCATAYLFHLGVLLTMAIFFPYPLLGIAFAPLFDLEQIADRIARTTPKGGRAALARRTERRSSHR